MNILFLTLLDFHSLDQQGIYTDLLMTFAKNGHHLYIISPVEKRNKMPTKLITSDNVNLLKLEIGNVQKTNIFEKGISTLTLESKFKKAIETYFNDVKFDLVLYTTPPITLQSAVAYVKKRDSAKTYLLLKDIFPQNALDLGMLKKTGLKGLLYKYFRNKEQKLYQTSDYIGCMSEANVEFLLNNNPIKSSKVEICPNTLTPRIQNLSQDDRVALRKKYNLPQEKVIFVYGGNLGKPQGVPFLKECIKANELRSNAHFLIVGSGTEYVKIKDYFDDNEFVNSTLYESIPRAEYENLVAACDVGMIFLDHRFTIPNFPSRLLSYMQAGLPVIAATDVNTDIGNVIRNGNFGYWCKSGELQSFNTIVDKFLDMERIHLMGLNSNRYLLNNYTSDHAYEIIMKHFE